MNTLQTPMWLAWFVSQDNVIQLSVDTDMAHWLQLTVINKWKVRCWFVCARSGISGSKQTWLSKSHACVRKYFIVINIGFNSWNGPVITFHLFVVYTITHPCRNFDDELGRLMLKPGIGWVIASQSSTQALHIGLKLVLNESWWAVYFRPLI